MEGLPRRLEVRVQQLGSLEISVMDRIWAHEAPVLVRDIVDELQSERAIAYTTVMTVMERLCRKGPPDQAARWPRPPVCGHSGSRRARGSGDARDSGCRG